MPSRSLKILLVEDNEAEIHQVINAIQGHNPKHKVEVLNDGEGVIEFLEKKISPLKGKYPDLVLLDLNLPRHNGRKVISEIKNHEKLKSTPIIVLTSSNFAGDILNSYKDKISSYIIKPEDSDGMIKAIQSALDFYSISQMPSNFQRK